MKKSARATEGRGIYPQNKLYLSKGNPNIKYSRKSKVCLPSFLLSESACLSLLVPYVRDIRDIRL